MPEETAAIDSEALPAFEIVCCISSHDTSVYYHLTPIARHSRITKLWIVRGRPSAYGEIPKAEYALVPAGFLPWRLLQIGLRCLRLARRPEVKAVISFNPIPYGSLALLAAWWAGKPLHLGFIGSDWNRHAKGRLGRFFRPLFRRARLVTATGSGMRREMVEYGLDPERVEVLPNAIDMDRYPVASPGSAEYAFIFVGELIPLKRVDLILRALARISPKHPEARICIAGRGRLEAELRSLAEQLGIADRIDFLGFVREVQPFLAKARAIVLASDEEGFPFSLVEAMSTGLVPISTAVGSVPEFITDGENGLLYPPGDEQALADRMNRVLEEPALYERLRAGALEMRERFSFEAATRIWDGWLSGL